MMEIPNPKLKAAMIKKQNVPLRWLGVWSLEFLWDFELGIWSF